MKLSAFVPPLRFTLPLFALATTLRTALPDDKVGAIANLTPKGVEITKSADGKRPPQVKKK